MARINTYTTDTNITDQDKWIGTDSNGGVTKNFTPEGVADWINSTNSVGIAGQSNFKFQTDLGTGRQNGTISFDAGSGDGTLFSTVNDIKISKYGADGNLILDFLQNLVGTFILLCQVDDTNNFGVYRLDSLTQDEVETDFYTAVLTVYGSNGTLQTDEYYGVVAYPGSSIVSVTGLEAIDEGNGVGWRLIGRDPDNYGNIGEGAIDFSNSNSISTEKGSVGDGAITFGTNNINQSGQSIVTGSGVSLKKTNEFSASNIVTGESPLNIWGVTYNSLIAAWRSEVNVEGTSYDTNVVYQSLIVGDGLNFYAGRDSGVVGGGLISGSTGCFTVGVGNEDLTTTTSNYITNYYNNYGPRFIVGCGTYQPSSGAITRQNGFVVMSDGTATFPIGNVGIGTTSPATKLEVTGVTTVRNSGVATPQADTDLFVTDATAAGSTAQIQILGGNAGNSHLYFSDTDSYSQGGIQYLHASDSMNIRVNATTAITINSSRNVGIGTTSPSYKLELGSGDFSLPLGSFIRFGPQIGITKASNGKLSIYGGTGATTAGGVDLYRWNGGAYSTALRLSNTGQLQFDEYGAGTFTGTAAQRLAVDSSGNVIEIPIGSGPVDGSGTANYVTKWSDTDTITNSSIYDSGSQVLIGATSSVFSDDLYINNSAYAQSGWRVGTTTTYVGKLVNNGGVLSLEATSTRSIGFRNTANGDIVRIDGINSRVGIGTTSPAFKLTVNSGADNTIARFASTDGTGTIVVADNAGSAYFSRLSNKIQIGGTSGDSALNLTVLDTGNVGIGITTPIYKLDVSGDIRGSAYRIGSATILSGSTSVFLGSSGSTGTVSLTTTAGQGLVLNGSNVGIGTTSPSYLLHVDGGTIGSNVDSTANNTSRQVNMTSANTTGMNAFTSYSTNTDVTPDFLGKYGYKLEGGTATANKQFQVYVSDAATPKMVVNGSGNVGIGTTSPGTKLDVAGDTPIIRLTDTRNMNVGDWDEVTLGKIEFYTSDTTSPGARVLSEIEAYSTAAAASGPESELRFKTSEISDSSPQTRMTISAEGDVGIGTTSPQVPLHVNGFARLNGGLQLNTANATIYQIQNSDLRFGTNNTEQMRITSTGNVGIGTTSPAYKLDIQAESPAIRMRDISDANSFLVGADNSGGYLGMFTNDSLRVYTNSLERLRVDSSGNVGVGTTSPSEKLDVDGNIKLGATTGRQLMFGENKYGAIRLGNNTVIGGNQAVDIRTGNASVSSQSSRVFINQTGNVGVGTTSPVATLDVNGSIKMGGSLLAPAANTVGAMRYRTDSNNSYVEMIMQTGASTYAWVVIKQNTW